MKKYLVLAVAVAAAAAVALTALTVVSPAAAAGTSRVHVPNLHGKKLPLSEALLRMAGLRPGTEDCDCTFGVVVKSSWYVCMQKPAAGASVVRGTRVWTYSVRDMGDC